MAIELSTLNLESFVLVENNEGHELGQQQPQHFPPLAWHGSTLAGCLEKRYRMFYLCWYPELSRHLHILRYGTIVYQPPSRVLPPETFSGSFFSSKISRIKFCRRLWYKATGGWPAHSEYTN